MTAPQTGAPSAPAAGTQGAPAQITVNAGGGDRSQTETRADAVQGIVDRLVTRHGTMARALEVLAGENFEHRETIRLRDESIRQLSAKQIPDGAIVLSGDDAKAWNAIKTIEGITPDKVPDAIKKSRELDLRLTTQDAEKRTADAAASLKYNPKVLAGLLSMNKLDLDMREIVIQDAAGKQTPTKVPFVRKAGDGNATWEKLSEVAERDFKEMLPALRTATPGTSTAAATGSPAVTPMPSQTAAPQGGADASGDAADQFLRSQNEVGSKRTNPLRPAKAAS